MACPAPRMQNAKSGFGVQVGGVEWCLCVCVGGVGLPSPPRPPNQFKNSGWKRCWEESLVSPETLTPFLVMGAGERRKMLGGAAWYSVNSE